MQINQKVDRRKLDKGMEPYLILSETADKEAFEHLMNERGVDVAFEWRYYYGYKDAIRIIDFVETKGIYDAWVVFLPLSAKKVADEMVAENPQILAYFDQAEEQFLRGLAVPILTQALASQQMTGLSLALTKQILKEEGLVFSDEEIERRKEVQRHRNETKKTKVGQTKLLIWLVTIVVVVLYLWLVGLLKI